MYTLLLTTFLSMPLYPLNPVVQDTLAVHSMQFAVGAAGPNEIVTAGPELTLKHEYLLHHPIVIQTAIEYRYGTINSKRFPNGHMHGFTLGASLLYYRGTNQLTGYLGAGLVYSTASVRLREDVADSLRTYAEITSADLSNTPGYQFLFGLRYRKTVSLEVTLTNTRPDFVLTRPTGGSSFARLSRPLKINEVRVSVGYILRLSSR